MCKNISTLILLYIVSFSISATAAGMDGMQQGATGTMQSTHTMMTREMVRDMSKMMQQMTIMTRDMNRIMEKSDAMDQTRTREMAQVMEQLSQTMHNLSQHMFAGNMDKNMMKEMEQHMNKISNTIQTMEQSKK